MKFRTNDLIEVKKVIKQPAFNEKGIVLLRNQRNNEEAEIQINNPIAEGIVLEAECFKADDKWFLKDTTYFNFTDGSGRYLHLENIRRVEE